MLMPQTLSAQSLDLPTEGSSQNELLTSIWKYRIYRIKSLQGQLLTPSEHRELQRLEQSLCAKEEAASRRRYRRFDCGFEAQLRMWHTDVPDVMPVRAMDLGAGGAKIAATRGVKVGDWVNLIVDQPVVLPGQVVMAAWVAWQNDDSAGLQFAGAPSIFLRGGMAA